MDDIGTLTLMKPQDSAVNLPTKPVRVLGIDLGTTNSTVAEALWTPTEGLKQPARCLEIDQPTYEGTYTNVLVPSVVAIHDAKVVVGEGAKRLRARAPELVLRQNKDLFYECKNEIGTKRTYHLAPQGFRSAAEIGGKVLEFLVKAAREYDLTPIDCVVVTVPASFQSAQRMDTVKAAELAGIEISGGDLLNEPVAAFLDYLQIVGKLVFQQLVHPKKLVVFDFGGGTCDVAVFDILPDRQEGRLKVGPLAASRYHRLGGGDIDAAIVYEVLLPQLIEQNQLSPFDLGFDEKRNVIGPAFLSLAEALKVGLCTEIQRLESFDKYSTAKKEDVVKKQPGVYSCKVNDRVLSLQGPTLSAAQFEQILKPFLDKDLLYARETEYRMTCSIFSPLQDALERGGLSRGNVDYCLMVGGSSLIPQVIEAVKTYFGKAKLLTFPDRESIQVAVARGAAYHALALELYGQGLIKAVSSDAIYIRSASGLVELVPKGAELPYPPDEGYRANRGLSVPQTILSSSLKLRVELVAGEEARTVFTGARDIPGVVNQGESLLLEYRMDENQVLDLQLRLANSSHGEPFSKRIENPLTNVVNPHSTRLRIDEKEESLRLGTVPKEEIPAVFVELAEDYGGLNQKEKAIEYLRRALRGKNAPDVAILDRMAFWYNLSIPDRTLRLQPTRRARSRGRAR